MADTWHGPFTVLGDLHPEDESHTSFHSQISCVFPVEGKKDLFIAMADRWVPDHMDYRYEEYASLFERIFSEGDEEASRLLSERFGEGGRRRTCDATYVWLPICFEGERPVIHWMDAWSL